MPGIGIGFGGWRKQPSPIGGMGGGAAVALGDSWGVIGDSMSYGDRRPKMYAHWLSLAMSGRLRWLPTVNVGTATCQGSNMGVSGQSTTQIAARAAQITAAGLDCVVFFSFENDGAGVTFATMRDNYRSIIAAAVAGGAKRVFVVGTGVTKSVFASGAIQARNAQLDDWIVNTMQSEYPVARAIAPATAWAGITLHDGAGGAGPDSFDGIHPNIKGAKRLAGNIWGAISAEIAAGDAYTANPYATNLFPADFSGTAGSISNATGQVATGLALTNTTGATVVAAKGTLDGRPSQIITISGTATANARVQLREVCSNVFVTNDAFDGWCRLKVTAADGVSAPIGLRAIGLELGGGRHTFLSQYHNETTEGGWLDAFSGVARAQPDLMASGASTLNTDLSVQLSIGPTIDARIEIADVKVFNMTQEAV